MGVNIIAEVGLNYAFGEDKTKFVENAKRLIDLAAVSGCTHVKFQKRNPEISTPENKKYEAKTVPWRKSQTVYLQYKRDIEFSLQSMTNLFSYAKEKNLIPFTSVWDVPSSQEMSSLGDLVKIPSAKLTDEKLLRSANYNFKTRILSTGMSTEEEIERAVAILEPQIIFHTNSTYPSPVEDLNMGYISYLMNKYPDKEIGYSNHAYGIEPMIASVVLGVKWIEFHITENHNYWGSDQSSSVEPVGVFKLTKGIRDIHLAFRKGNEPRVMYPGEEKKKESLRG